ncbi:hypothetical protein MY7_0344 [Bacillus sp. 5B6]|nr:hypothetical protein MY7_0344 [Bacillus sp. 5B6]
MTGYSKYRLRISWDYPSSNDCSSFIFWRAYCFAKAALLFSIVIILLVVS